MTDTDPTFREQYAVAIMATLVVIVLGGWIVTTGCAAIGDQLVATLQAALR